MKEVICPACSHRNGEDATVCAHCYRELPNPHMLPYALNPRILAVTWVGDKLRSIFSKKRHNRK